MITVVNLRNLRNDFFDIENFCGTKFLDFFE